MNNLSYTTQGEKKALVVLCFIFIFYFMFYRLQKILMVIYSRVVLNISIGTPTVSRTSRMNIHLCRAVVIKSSPSPRAATQEKHMGGSHASHFVMIIHTTIRGTAQAIRGDDDDSLRWIYLSTF